MEIGGNKGAIKGHSLHSYHHIIHSLVLLASSEPLPKGYRRKQYIGFFDVLTYLDLCQHFKDRSSLAKIYNAKKGGIKPTINMT